MLMAAETSWTADTSGYERRFGEGPFKGISVAQPGSGLCLSKSILHSGLSEVIKVRMVGKWNFFVYRYFNGDRAVAED